MNPDNLENVRRWLNQCIKDEIYVSINIGDYIDHLNMHHKTIPGQAKKEVIANITAIIELAGEMEGVLVKYVYDEEYRILYFTEEEISKRIDLGKH